MHPDAIDARIVRWEHDAYSARQAWRSEKKAFQLARRAVRDIEQAQQVAQQVAQTIQQQAHAKIAGVVTTCLKSVFGPDTYEFKIKFERKRNKTEAKIVFVKDGEEITDPINEDSGGVVDVAAFALRLACLVSVKPALRRFLVLDEPFRFVSKKYRENVRQMLVQLSEEFNLQIVMVTHVEEFMVGKVIRL